MKVSNKILLIVSIYLLSSEIRKWYETLNYKDNEEEIPESIQHLYV